MPQKCKKNGIFTKSVMEKALKTYYANDWAHILGVIRLSFSPCRSPVRSKLSVTSMRKSFLEIKG